MLPQLYPALNPQSNKTRQNERNDVSQIAANGGPNGGPNQSTHMETLEMETLQKNSWVYGTELKWSKPASRPKLSKLSKLVECDLEWPKWSNMIKIVQMA